MFLWSTFFTTLGPFSRIPRLLCVASERRHDSSYHHRGRLRKNESHALFKYTLSGTGVFRDAKGDHRVPPEHGFLCEVNDPAIEYFHPGSGAEPWTFVFVTFDGDCAFQWVRDLVRKSGPIFHLPLETGIIQQLLSFGKNAKRHRVIQAGWGSELTLAVLLTLTRSTENSMANDESGGLVRRVRELVANHLDQDLNGKEIAQRLRVSREHLSRVFRRETGTPLHTYILRQKMDYACYLLKHSELNSKEVAAQLGYESPTHFSRTFRRIKAMTPGDFKAEGGTTSLT